MRTSASHRIPTPSSPSLVTSRIGSLGSRHVFSKHVFKMASRREGTRREEGFYGRLHRFSTADEWKFFVRGPLSQKENLRFRGGVYLGRKEEKGS